MQSKQAPHSKYNKSTIMPVNMKISLYYTIETKTDEVS